MTLRGQKGQDEMGVPVKEVCRAYRLRAADVKGYVMTLDYVSVIMAGGRRYRFGRLPAMDDGGGQPSNPGSHWAGQGLSLRKAVRAMTDRQRTLRDACEAAGIAASELAEYRITADTVRLVAKDGRKWVVARAGRTDSEIVRLNPELTIGEAAKAATTKPGRGKRRA